MIENQIIRVKYLVLKEAAQYLCVSERTIRRRISSLEISYILKNGRYYFTHEQLDSYMDSGKTPAIQEIGYSITSPKYTQK